MAEDRVAEQPSVIWLSKNIFVGFASQYRNREYYLTSEVLPLNRVTKRKSRSSPPAALPLCRSARTSGGTANYRSVVPEKVFVCSLRHNGKNFHSLFLRNARPGARFNQQPHCCIVCLLWRGAGRGGAGRMYAAPSRFYIGARNGNGQHELVVSCRSSPRPRRAGSIFQGLLPPSSPYSLPGTNLSHFALRNRAGAASKDIRGSL